MIGDQRLGPLGVVGEERAAADFSVNVETRKLLGVHHCA